MNAKEIKKKLNLNVKHSLYRNNGYWYHHLTQFPGALFDNNGYIIFITQTEYLNNPALMHTQSLHVKGGISSLSGYVYYSKEQKHLLGVESNAKGVDEKALRKIQKINRIQRNSILVDDIKKLYQFTCQICGTQLEIRRNLFYSEVHHIKPLGAKHNGPDIKENMISVCPNDHALLDLGAIKIDSKNLIVKHSIRQDFLEYHNSKIFMMDI